MTPPLSVRGRYAWGEVGGGAFNVLLADNQHLVWFENYAIYVFDRVDRDLDLMELDERTPLWTYRADQDPEGLDPLLLRTPAFANVNGKRCIIYLSIYPNGGGGVFTNRIYARNLATGEVEWVHEIQDAFFSYLVVIDNVIFVRHAPLLNFTGEATLLRILPGADAPTHVRTDLEFPYLEMAASGTGLFVAEDLGLSRYSLATLERQWTSEGSEMDFIVDFVVANTGQAYVVESEGRVYSLDANGNVRWTRQLPMDDEEDGCVNPMTIVTNGDIVVVSGVCKNQLVALENATGEIRWQIRTETQEDRTAPLFSGNRLYVSAQTGEFLAGNGLVLVYDIETGNELERHELPGSLGPTFLMATNGLLYAMETDLVADPPNNLWVYETEPALLVSGITNSDRFPCGVYQNQPIALEVPVGNLGPGIAPNTELRVDVRGVDVSWTSLPEGYDIEHIPFGDNLRVRFGDMDVAHVETLLFELTPQQTGTLEISVSLTSDVRNPVPSERGETLELLVNRPLSGDLDVWIEKVEIVQVIQDEDQSIPLIAGKPTLIRVFARSNSYVEGVNARLRISGSTLSPTDTYLNEPGIGLNNCRTLDGLAPVRTNMGSTFNFLVPPRMLEGRPDGVFDFEVTLDPLFNLTTETNYANNTYSGTIEFVHLPPLCLVNYRVHTLRNGGGSVISNSLIPQETINRALSLFPTGNMVQYPQSNVLEKLGFFTWNPYELDPGGSMNTWRLLGTVWMHEKTSSDPANCLTTHYVGVVDEDNRTTHPDGNQFNGIGHVPGRSLVFRINNSTQGVDPINQPRGGTTLAHELGHNFNRNHVDCGNPDGPDSNYPYPACQLGPLTGNLFLGYDLFDPANPVLVVPTDPATATNATSDLMSYAPIRWTSDYNWLQMYVRQLLFAGMLDTPFSPETPSFLSRSWKSGLRGTSGKSLLVSGAIFDDGTGEMGPLQLVGEGVVPEEKELEMDESTRQAMIRNAGPAVELLDEVGALIIRVPVEMMRVNDEEPAFDMFGTFIPEPDGLATVRFVDGDGTVIDSVTRSANAPVVELLQPTASTVVDGLLIVEWNASDADGDPLTALVQYSTDNGATWRTLVTNAPASPYELPTDLLPGAIGTARIRLVVSDGFNATEALSPAFTVLKQGPVVTISERPGGGSSYPFRVDGAIHLSGSAFDPEDGPLVGEALTWEIDGIGFIGSGNTALVPTPPPGTYRVTLTAIDSDGNQGHDEFILTVLEDFTVWVVN